MPLTQQTLSEHTSTPQRDSSIKLIAETWVKQTPSGITHNKDFSIVRFPNCPNRPETTDGGFAVKVFDDYAQPICFHDKCAGHDWETTLGPCPLQEKPWILPAADFGLKHSQRRQPIIHGLLDRGDVMNIVAPSKLGKSYFLMQMVLAIVAGLPWSGYETTPGRVLIIDNELQPDTIWSRLQSVLEAMGLDDDVLEKVDIASLRGNLIGLDELSTRIQRLPKGRYSLIVCDALYRMLPRGCDENGNADVTQLYNTLDAAATAHGCAIAVVHHSSKGDQSKKSVTDVGSGAGAQSRAADCHLVLRPHANLGCVTMQAAVRAHAPVQSVVLRREHPLWVVATEVDPKQLRNGKATFTLDEFKEWLKPGEHVVNELKEQLRAEKELTKEQVANLIGEAIKHGSLTLVDGPANQKRKVVKH